MRGLDDIYKRKRILETGGVLTIPFPVIGFRGIYPGLEKEQIILNSSYSKGSKTQFTSWAFLYNTIDYVIKYNKKQTNEKNYMHFNLFYCNWEESIERVEQRFMSYLLFKYFKIRVSPAKLRSAGNHIIPEDVLAKLESPQVKEELDYWHNHVTYITETNPTAIWKTLKTFLCEHGKEEREKYNVKYYEKNELTGKDEIREETREKVVGYTEDNPNSINLIFIDHISCCTTERGMTLKQSIDKIVDYCVGFRNTYKVSTVIIQQQNTQGESAQNIKINKIRPSKEGLADSTYTGNYCNVMFGLFSPIKYEIENYCGYQIKGGFGDNIRFLECVLNRDGAASAGELLPLFFDGAISWYHELPSWRDIESKEMLNKWYALAKKYQSEKKVKIPEQRLQMDIDFLNEML
jgi:hypothetical protein